MKGAEQRQAALARQNGDRPGLNNLQRHAIPKRYHACEATVKVRLHGIGTGGLEGCRQRTMMSRRLTLPVPLPSPSQILSISEARAHEENRGDHETRPRSQRYDAEIVAPGERRFAHDDDQERFHFLDNRRYSNSSLNLAERSSKPRRTKKAHQGNCLGGLFFLRWENRDSEPQKSDRMIVSTETIRCPSLS